MKFIDLSAGLGGFHQALKRLGHQCVFACEIDDQLNTLYEKNFGLKPADEVMRALPSYSRRQQKQFPTWKIRFIRENREFYDTHKNWIDKWPP